MLFLGLLLTCAAAGAPGRFVSGRILIKPKPGVTENEFQSKLLRHGGRQHHAIHRSNVRVVNVTEANAAGILAALQRDPTIEFAERDYVAEAAFVPNDTYVVSGSEWHLEKIMAPQAWNINFGASNIIIAVLDSGINAAHPDLSANTLPGYDFVWDDNDPNDDYGHGTAVVGVIAAAGNNGIGVAGVAFHSKILPVKVMDASGFAAYSTLAQGIRYAVDQGARIINISIAGNSPSSTLQDAINYAWNNNVIVVAAAGNTASSGPQYPAACEYAVAVSATEPDDTLATFSSTGNHLALAAPGDNIFTTSRDLARPYAAWRGTSFASPVVAGVAALVASANSSLNNTQIVELLKQTADDVGVVGFDASFGHGRVNAARAVSEATGIPIGDAEPQPPLPSPPAATNPPPPEVVLTRPTPNATLRLGTMVSLAAAATTTNSAVTNLEFYANGVRLAGGNRAALAYNWRPVQPGVYSIMAAAMDALGQRATSTSVEIVVVDMVPPSLTVSSAPPNNARLNEPDLTLAGTARDNIGVARVEVQVNDAPYMPVDGTNVWRAQIQLIAGKNTIRLRSVDLAGNISPANTRVFTWVVLSQLTLQTNGLGAVTPDLNGSWLEIGKTYTIRAVPRPGQVFTGWPGVPWQNTVFSFVMRSNLTLAASFIPDPFQPLKGSYAGLIWNTNGVTPDSSGQLSLQLANAGLFSARLNLGLRGYRLAGRFDLNGQTTISIRRGALPPLALTLNLDMANGTDQVSGSLADTNSAMDLLGDRNVFNPSSNPAPQAGLRSFVLLSTNATTVVPMAITTNSAKITTSGLVTLRGALGDGRRFTLANALARHGDSPFYLSLSKGSEVVMGWMNFPGGSSNAVAGDLAWVRTGTNAFATTLQATATTSTFGVENLPGSGRIYTGP